MSVGSCTQKGLPVKQTVHRSLSTTLFKGYTGFPASEISASTHPSTTSYSPALITVPLSTSTAHTCFYFTNYASLVPCFWDKYTNSNGPAPPPTTNIHSSPWLSSSRPDATPRPVTQTMDRRTEWSTHTKNERKKKRGKKQGKSLAHLLF